MRATIARDGSVRLPAAARARLELDPGSIVRIDVQDDRIVIRRVRRRAAGAVLSMPDPLLALRRDEAGETYVALAYERRVHE